MKLIALIRYDMLLHQHYGIWVNGAFMVYTWPRPVAIDDGLL